MPNKTANGVGLAAWIKIRNTKLQAETIRCKRRRTREHGSTQESERQSAFEREERNGFARIVRHLLFFIACEQISVNLWVQWVSTWCGTILWDVILLQGPRTLFDEKHTCFLTLFREGRNSPQKRRTLTVGKEGLSKSSKLCHRSNFRKGSVNRSWTSPFPKLTCRKLRTRLKHCSCRSVRFPPRFRGSTRHVLQQGRDFD